MEKSHEIIKDIPGYHKWKDITIPENLGWSANHKFRVSTINNESLIVRVSDISHYEEKKKEYDNIVRLSKTGINAPKPIDFGICNNGNSVYMVLTWIDGTAVEDIIRSLDSGLQYDLGVKAGKLLKTIHHNSAVETDADWGDVYGKNIDAIIAAYHKTGVRIRHEEAILEYISQNRYLLSSRNQVIRHGDFHVGNLIITPDNHIAIIDFDKCYPGDPWEEFGGIVWAARLSKAFANGQVAGYFNGQPPDAFFKLLALYIGVYALEHVVRALGHRPDERRESIMANTDFMSTMFDNFRTHIPDFWISLI